MVDRQLATRLQAPVAGRDVRRWTLNDQHGHYHGVVDLAESPMVLSLSWRRSADAQAAAVGTYRLDLRALLDAGLVRRETTQGAGKVRVRVVRTSDGTFRLQVRDGAPHLNLES